MKSEFNVLVNPGFKNEHIRLVIHKDIIKQDIDYLVDVMDHIVNGSQLQIDNLDSELVFRDRNCKIDLDKFEPKEE